MLGLKPGLQKVHILKLLGALQRASYYPIRNISKSDMTRARNHKCLNAHMSQLSQPWDKLAEQLLFSCLCSKVTAYR